MTDEFQCAILRKLKPDKVSITDIVNKFSIYLFKLTCLTFPSKKLTLIFWAIIDSVGVVELNTSS